MESQLGVKEINQLFLDLNELVRKYKVPEDLKVEQNQRAIEAHQDVDPYTRTPLDDLVLKEVKKVFHPRIQAFNKANVERFGEMIDKKMYQFLQRREMYMQANHSNLEINPKRELIVLAQKKTDMISTFLDVTSSWIRENKSAATNLLRVSQQYHRDEQKEDELIEIGIHNAKNLLVDDTYRQALITAIPPPIRHVIDTKGKYISDKKLRKLVSNSPGEWLPYELSRQEDWTDDYELIATINKSSYFTATSNTPYEVLYLRGKRKGRRNEKASRFCIDVYPKIPSDFIAGTISVKQVKDIYRVEKEITEQEKWYCEGGAKFHIEAKGDFFLERNEFEKLKGPQQREAIDELLYEVNQADYRASRGKPPEKGILLWGDWIDIHSDGFSKELQVVLESTKKRMDTGILGHSVYSIVRAYDDYTDKVEVGGLKTAQYIENTLNSVFDL